MRGHPVDAEHPERERQRQVVFAHPTDHGRSIGNGAFLPAEPAGNAIAGRELRCPGFDHFAHGQRAHHAADCDRIRIIARVGDPAAHGRFDREKTVGDADLALAKRRIGHIADGKVLGLCDAGRP